MGRPPKPTFAINNSISHRTKKQLETRAKNEPKIEPTYKFVVPRYLTAAAKEEWYKLINMHKRLDRPIWTAFDVPAIARYCEHLVMWRKLQTEWKIRQDVMIINAKGDVCISPIIGQINSMNKVLLAEEDKLCISVIGRARIGTAAYKAGEKNNDDDLLD